MFHSPFRALQRVAFTVFLAGFGSAAFAQATWYQDTDNENNAHTHVADNDMENTVGNTDLIHPIEFNISVGALPKSSAVLTMRAYDVDEEQGEQDDVYVNGHFLGHLTGANNVWSVTSFNVNPAWLVTGNNLIEVQVDTSGDATPWVVGIDWGQILVDGGGAVDGDTRGVQITGYSINAGTVTINTSTQVHSTTGGNYRLQISLIDPSGNAVTVLTQDFAAAAGADVVRSVNPTYPLSSVSGVYTIQAQLFWLDPAHGNFPVQQDIATAQFTHTANSGPSNFQNDSDGDGLLDSVEATLGTNPNNADTDGDGIGDGAEVGPNVNAPLDTDGDGIIDARESSIVDTDGDGVMNQADPANNNPCVPNANSAVCLAADSDGDGLTNAQEDALGTNRNNADTDGDGFNDGAEVGPNVNAPLDTDGDGIPNVLESAITDTDGDGVVNQNDAANNNPCVPNANSAPCLALDNDADGLTNAQEDALGTSRNNADTDGDGINDGVEVGGNVNAPLDTDGDGVINALDPANGNPCVPNANSAACLALDNDGDGLSNGQEAALGTDPNNADSDGDGVSDGVEIGNPAHPTDTDGDGVPDALESGSAAAHADTDNDGIPDSVEYGPNPATPRDTDGDGIADYLDTDSDGDGIPDALEVGPNPAQPLDTDGDGTPDYRDTDSDDDTLPDSLEGGASGVDTDGDGIDDAFDVDEVGGADANHDGVADSALPRDTDGDGLADFRDVDTDNDGILDSVEGTPTLLTDTDGDGIPDVRDLDSDDDGRPDVIEAGLIDANLDGFMDAGQTRTANPPDTDGDGTPDFRDLDSNNDGTFDIVGTAAAAHDANHDGRVDAGADADEDGIRDAVDASPSLYGTLVDGDGDGVADSIDGDLDNDGIPNADDGADDTDGDGLPNLFDLDSDGDGVPDLVEAGGVDADGDGRVDNFVDTNHNGISDQYETALGGHPLTRPDTDHDGIPDFRDLDSDGDGINDVLENGGTDANGDGRMDGTDADHNGIVDVVEGTKIGGKPLRRPDTDGDGTVDALDLDSDGDGVSDAREGFGDSDHDGIPDSLDKPGQLQTAVRGTGAFDAFTVGGLLAVLGFAAVRRRRENALRALTVVCAVLGFAGMSPRAAEAKAKDPVVKEGWYVGLDAGMSRLEPRNKGGGYRVDDDQSLGMRLEVGYAWSPHWSAEAYYADGGKAGISSDNPAVGHLGDLEYRMGGVGVEWAPFGAGRDAKFFPLIKLGLVQITNKSSSSEILYKKLNDTGVYLGGGAGLRFGKSWIAQAEVVSYDQDELFFTLGLRKHF
ncbi:MAG TPA: outer membrane beta-barrel protein [Steroidobacteraceae bacterium]|nr:outer membrane beta-barrel protein [Steroidobacteraceae bacterium]